MHTLARMCACEPACAAATKQLLLACCRSYGLSEHTAEQIRRAHAVHPCAAVQLEWSLFARDEEKDVIPVCR